jgi:LCP family protein required for cell wall assembly
MFVALIWLATRDRDDILSWSVRPRWLSGLIIISIATLIGRVWVTIDAAQTAGISRNEHPRRTMVWLTVILALVALPHVVVVDLAWQQRGVVTHLFASEAAATARPTPLAAERRITSAVADDLDGPAGPTTTPEFEEGVESTETTPPTTADSVPAPPEAPANWDGDNRLSIVMLGSDGGYDRVGIRTDTIIVLSIDVATGNAVTFSVPRNWENIPFPNGTPADARYPYGNPDLANTIYGIGLRRPELFPDSVHPGGAAVKEAMAQTLGLPIQYFVMVDMTAVVETIDLFGGIDLTVTEYINDRIRPIEEGGPWLEITTTPGEYHFDGLTTLAYVRSRVQSWDYNRMARQRCVVGALIDQVSPIELLTNFGAFSDIVLNNVVTDIPLDRADELIGIAGLLDPSRIQTVNFVPPGFPDGGPVPLRQVRNSVDAALTTPDLPDPDQTLTGACNGE